MAGVTDRLQARLGAVQETLFIPLAARARETRRKRPVLRDPKAVEMVESIDYDTAKYGRGAGGSVTVLRTAIFDMWVRAFLAGNPAGTVVEIGTGLNTRFERVDNGVLRWIDLDLPDTIGLRRSFFSDTGRRRMVAASVLDETWLPIVRESPGPYIARPLPVSAAAARRPAPWQVFPHHSFPGRPGSMTGAAGEHRLYRDLAGWWPLISPAAEYAQEAAYLAAVFRSAAIPVREVLDLGSGR
jgi:hypothetical protein